MLWHLEGLIAVDGGISAHEADGVFFFVVGPLFELVKEAIEGEVDIVSELGDGDIHKQQFITLILIGNHTNHKTFSPWIIFCINPNYSFILIYSFSNISTPFFSSTKGTLTAYPL